VRTFGRLAVVTLGAFCLVWLSALAYSLLAQHLLVGRNWWRAYPAVIYGIEILVFVPFAVVIALLSRGLFPRRAVACAFACTLAAMAVLFVPMANGSYEMLLASLNVNKEFVLTFVIGVPLLVFAGRSRHR
jgi:hypothetical protein